MAGKPPVVILCGGKGTRLKAVAGDRPKPMVAVHDRPVLEHLVEMCRREGFLELHLMEGYLAEQIRDYFGDGSRWGVRLHHHPERTPLGTAGSISAIQDGLADEFVVLYGDVYMNLSLDRLVDFHRRKGGAATLVVHPNSHPHDSDLIEFDEQRRISAFHRKPHPVGQMFSNQVNAGAYVLTRSVLHGVPADRIVDFGHDVFPESSRSLPFFAYPTFEYMKDMGTPERLDRVSRDLRAGIPEARRYDEPPRAVFFDRDGTINRFVPFLDKKSDFAMLPGVPDALRRLNQSEWLSVLTTNQPQVARGQLTLAELKEIHTAMEWTLGTAGSYFDGIYFCPHHPDKGFLGERPEFKIECECRKPGAGMYRQAATDMNIDLAQSVVIGDTERDIAAGHKIGARTILVLSGETSDPSVLKTRPDFVAQDVGEAVRLVLERHS